MKKVFLKNYGCQMNVRDSEVITGLLVNNNYRLTDDPGEADIIIFNTCSVRQHAEDKVWSEVGRFKRSQGHKVTRSQVIGVVGCMAQNYKDEIFRRAPNVDFVVGPSDIQKIPEIIKKVTRPPDQQATSENLFEVKIWETEGEGRPEEIYHTGFYQDKEHAYVVISEGCSNFCSYCVVPYVRGPLRNRYYQDIIGEIEEAVSNGIKRITLLGQNVNSYRSQEHKSTRAQVSFVELLELVNGIKGLKEFSFITSHPKDTTIELFKAMADCDKLK